jgi:hypothetical protein
MTSEAATNASIVHDRAARHPVWVQVTHRINALAMLMMIGSGWQIYTAQNNGTPGVYEYLEAERIKYASRLPANQVLQNRIGYLLKRPVGRPPNEVRRYYANFAYQAASWTTPRRVIALSLPSG